jgi:DNA-binding transcriptional LysR family regulator
MMINPTWLQSFCKVVETSSFTRAAEQLDLTQAAVSQHLQRLEAQTGLLLLRHGRQLELTPKGHALLAYAQELHGANQRLTLRLQDDAPLQGAIRLATPGSIGLRLYPALLALQQQYPALRVDMRFAPTQSIAQAVLSQQVELGVLTLRQSQPQLHNLLLTHEDLCLVCPAEQAADSWQDLCNLGFIDHPDGHDMASRWLARQYPGQRLEQLPCHGFINQIGLILEPVARGLGFTVLPRFAVQAYHNQQALRLVEAQPAVQDPLWLIYRNEWPLSRAAQLALEQIQRCIQGDE